MLIATSKMAQVIKISKYFKLSDFNLKLQYKNIQITISVGTLDGKNIEFLYFCPGCYHAVFSGEKEIFDHGITVRKNT